MGVYSKTHPTSPTLYYTRGGCLFEDSASSLSKLPPARVGMLFHEAGLDVFYTYIRSRPALRHKARACDRAPPHVAPARIPAPEGGALVGRPMVVAVKTSP
jgi:hypothetical protein